MATESVSGERVPSQFIRGFYSSCSYIFSIFSQNTPSLYSVQKCSFLVNLSEIEKGPVYITKLLIVYPASVLLRARKIALALKLICLLSLYLLDSWLRQHFLALWTHSVYLPSRIRLFFLVNNLKGEGNWRVRARHFFLATYIPCLEDSFSWIIHVRLQHPLSSVHNEIMTSWPAYAARTTLVPTPWTCAAEGAAKSACSSHRKIVSPKPEKGSSAP